MKNRLHITRIAALFITTLLLAGCASTYIKNGKESYNNLQYQDAIYFFEKGLKKKDNPDARRKLGESYLLTNDYKNAVTVYEGTVTYTDNTDKDRINYARALMGVERYADAKVILEGVVSRDASNQVAADLLNSCKKVADLKKDSLMYMIEPVNIPLLPSLFSATSYDGGLIVSSPSGKGDKDPYTGGTYNNLFYTKKSGATWSNPEELENVNGKFHDAAASVSPNGQTMVFTRSFQLNSGKMASNDQKVSNTQLYTSKKAADGKWEKPYLLPFSDSKYMYAHPAFSVDGKKMYFSSDMPGGHGAMDIWEVPVSDGNWGAPTNLGTNINTKGNEVFPTVRGENGLYFSSDAHQSLGGLDILESSNKTGMWSIPKHVSYPVNTSTDDFGMIWNEDGKTGYFTSDRSGSDKLYSFTEEETKVKLDGLITDKKTMLPVKGAKIILKNLTDGTEVMLITDEDGKFNADLDRGKQYQMLTEADGYFKQTETFSTVGVTEPITKVIEMEELITKDPTDDGTLVALNGLAVNAETGKPVPNATVTIKNLTDGTTQTVTTDSKGKFSAQLPRGKDYQVILDSKDLEGKHNLSTKGADPNTPIAQSFEMWKKGKQPQPPVDGNGTPSAVYTVPNIFWDYNKADVRPDAEPYLDNIVKLFRDNTDLKFELRSHTDCRGSEAFNVGLSDRRAQAAADYLIKKGVPRSSIVSKGYGEQFLINDCRDGMECTEQQHQQNRRTEFMVIGKKK